MKRASAPLFRNVHRPAALEDCRAVVFTKRIRATGIDWIVHQKNTVLNHLQATSIRRWPTIIDEFVDGMAQVHTSSAPVVCVILTDFAEQVSSIAASRVGSLAARLSSAGLFDSNASPSELCSSARTMFSNLEHLMCSEADVAEQVSDYVGANLESHLTESIVAAAVHCSRSMLVKSIRYAHCCTVRQFVKRSRLKAAFRLITAGDKIEAVIRLVGYGNRTAFYRDFKIAYGLSPGQIRPDTRPREVTRCTTRHLDF